MKENMGLELSFGSRWWEAGRVGDPGDLAAAWKRLLGPSRVVERGRSALALTWSPEILTQLLVPPSAPRYSEEAQSMDHRCSCCKEIKTSQKVVELNCEGGGTLAHKYTYIESCGCQDSICGIPLEEDRRASQSRSRRALRRPRLEHLPGPTSTS